MHFHIPIDQEQIRAFCGKWHITSFALFGSVLREDFGPESDIDVLVTFAPTAGVSLLGYMQMVNELEALFGRKIDLVTTRSLAESRNSIRREAILTTAKVIYATAA